ncbi:hypothetical protein IE53DRAFT_177673 [Violaceomyces palustris]|uniref:Uncharacterized protein n=1 Tax=Violaceomyces palustris TaxID=1673888 RepID=A0ACD0NSL1_9BASI|nr:hypothetical protein IE53DRAFT_177673 [Violaceomyces palustris]
MSILGMYVRAPERRERERVCARNVGFPFLPLVRYPHLFPHEPFFTTILMAFEFRNLFLKEFALARACTICSLSLSLLLLFRFLSAFGPFTVPIPSLILLSSASLIGFPSLTFLFSQTESSRSAVERTCGSAMGWTPSARSGCLSPCLSRTKGGSKGRVKRRGEE